MGKDPKNNGSDKCNCRDVQHFHATGATCRSLLADMSRAHISLFMHSSLLLHLFTRLTQKSSFYCVFLAFTCLQTYIFIYLCIPLDHCCMPLLRCLIILVFFLLFLHVKSTNLLQHSICMLQISALLLLV